MKKMIVAFSLLIFACTLVTAQTKLSPAAQKASEMVKSGISFYQANGKEAAFAAFNDSKGKFRDGEYYLFVYDYTKDGTAICLARGDGNMAMIGKDLWATKDPNGTLYYQEFVTAAKAGNGWVDYKRTNPETKKIEEKSSYIARIPNTTFLIGCGFYKD